MENETDIHSPDFNLHFQLCDYDDKSEMDIEMASGSSSSETDLYDDIADELMPIKYNPFAENAEEPNWRTVQEWFTAQLLIGSEDRIELGLMRDCANFLGMHEKSINGFNWKKDEDTTRLDANLAIMGNDWFNKSGHRQLEYHVFHH